MVLVILDFFIVNKTGLKEEDQGLRARSGKTIDYLRISLTDRCNFRCRYCMPEKGVDKFSHDDILTYEEIRRLIRVFSELGVKKFRFTGGEPLVRRGILDLLGAIVRERKGIHLTTNLTAPGLDIEKLNRLRLDGINVSCDSLKPSRYSYITRGGELEVFLENLNGLKVGNLKLNVVVILGFNEDEIEDFISLGRERNITVRFIEKMDSVDSDTEFVSLSPIKERLIRQGAIRKEGFRKNNSVAEYHYLLPGPGMVGFITPISHSFCDTCSKIRLMANGEIKLCLFDRRGYPLRPILRSGAPDAEIKDFLVRAVSDKFPHPPDTRGRETIAKMGG